MLLRETSTTPSYEDAVVLVGKFAAHFPRRDENERAVVIGDIAASCERNEITIMGLAVALTELAEAARAENPFMPPTGEIISRAKSKSRTFSACLDSEMKRAQGLLK